MREQQKANYANIGVIGTGYVGLVTGACFAKLGHKVICSDIDEQKVEKLKGGHCPIFEEGLPEILREAVTNGNLSFTTDNANLINETNFIFICVGTPEKEDGGANLSYVYESCQQIGRNIKEPKYIVIKSTVPYTAVDLIREEISKDATADFELLANPEFLAQGTAVADFLEPDRVVIGADNEKAAKKLAGLYEKIDAPVVLTDIASAILIKYASNAFLATKISFINAMANLCEKAGANISKVAEGMGYDKRIGNLFLRAGVGYGGSCFPKDTKALYHMAKESGYEFNLIKEVIKVNRGQRQLVLDKLNKHLGSLKGKKIAMLGLAFKPGTDDLREAPSIYLISDLLNSGCSINAYDPVVNKLKGYDGIGVFNDVYKAVKGADAVILVTDYPELKEVDFKKIAELVNNKLIIDGRNILPASLIKALGFSYSSIGGYDG